MIVTTVTRARMPVRVEPHDYRKTLASAAQLDWIVGDRERPTKERFLYGLLVFGGHYRARMLKFCRIAFPDPDGNLAPGTIDLVARHGHVLDPFRDEEYVNRQVAEFIRIRESSRNQ